LPENAHLSLTKHQRNAAPTFEYLLPLSPDELMQHRFDYKM